jgi:hypothetical protein
MKHIQTEENFVNNQNTSNDSFSKINRKKNLNNSYDFTNNSSNILKVQTKSTKDPTTISKQTSDNESILSMTKPVIDIYVLKEKQDLYRERIKQQSAFQLFDEELNSTYMNDCLKVFKPQSQDYLSPFNFNDEIADDYSMRANKYKVEDQFREYKKRILNNRIKIISRENVINNLYNNAPLISEASNQKNKIYRKIESNNIYKNHLPSQPKNRESVNTNSSVLYQSFLDQHIGDISQIQVTSEENSNLYTSNLANSLSFSPKKNHYFETDSENKMNFIITKKLSKKVTELGEKDHHYLVEPIQEEIIGDNINTPQFKSRVNDEEVKVVKIQNLYRRKQMIKHKKDEIKMEMLNEMASRIQNSFRRQLIIRNKKGEFMNEEMNNMACKIQNAFRKKLILKNKKEELKKEEVNTKATKIQQTFKKKYKVRENLITKKATKIQCAFRAKKAKKLVETHKENKKIEIEKSKLNFKMGFFQEVF